MKKLKKELNKLLPKGKKVAKKKIEIDELPVYNGKYALYFFVEEKEKQPEWIRITEVELAPLTKNKLYRVENWYKSYPSVIEDNGNIVTIALTKWQPATPAEIEAHKLGFHVGDEVWLKAKFNSNEPDIIDYFSFKSDITGLEVPLRAYFNDGETWAYLSDLSKTPPKQPILQKDGKYLFYGDEYWYIDKEDNWKLEKYNIDFPKEWYQTGWNEIRFTTKEKALEYVLTEVINRFDGCEQIYGKNCHKVLKLNRPFKIQSESIIDSALTNIWDEYSGFAATPIKNNLMLGEYEVTIENGVIKAKDGKVTKHEWNEFYSNFIKAYNLSIMYFELKLCSYNVYCSIIQDKISIGCIENVTLDQIEAINKAVDVL